MNEEIQRMKVAGEGVGLGEEKSGD